MMKKRWILFLMILLLIGTTACSNNGTATADQSQTQPATAQATETAAQESTHPVQTEASAQTAAPAQTESPEPTERRSSFDPYATANVYDLSAAWFERQSGTDYGTLLTDVAYFSTTADDTKRVNILLPPGYDEAGAYPVLYMIHGWGGDYTAHLYEDSYLHMVYGNMYREGLAEPMIIVGVDMYTGKQSVKDDLDGYGRIRTSRRI